MANIYVSPYDYFALGSLPLLIVSIVPLSAHGVPQPCCQLALGTSPPQPAQPLLQLQVLPSVLVFRLICQKQPYFSPILASEWQPNEAQILLKINSKNTK